MKMYDTNDKEITLARLWLKFQGFVVAVIGIVIAKLLDMLIDYLGGPMWVRVVVFAAVVIVALWSMIANEDRRQ